MYAPPYSSGAFFFSYCYFYTLKGLLRLYLISAYSMAYIILYFFHLSVLIRKETTMEDEFVCPCCGETISTWDCTPEVSREDCDSTETVCPECGKAITVRCELTRCFFAEQTED